MIQLDQIKNYFPPQIQGNPAFNKYMMKEYLQLTILDFLSSSSYIGKLALIGGTNLRLIKGIDRFSEELDFDCKNLSKDEFMKMTDSVLVFLKRHGYNVVAKDSYSDKLKAFRRSIYFPEFLFELGLSGHREERFLIKIESQDQQIIYKHKMAAIKGCGLYFMFPVPVDEVLCAMKVSALLSRQKGRDFYDVMFLMGQVKPDFDFLYAQRGISNMDELKQAFEKMLHSTNLSHKAKDFEHLAFDKSNTRRILLFNDFVSGILFN